MNDSLLLSTAARQLHLDVPMLMEFIKDNEIAAHPAGDGQMIAAAEVIRFQPILNRKIALLLAFVCLANGATLPARLDAEVLDGVLLLPVESARMNRTLAVRIRSAVLECGEATNITAMLALAVKKLGYEGDERDAMIEVATRMQQTFRAMIQLTQLPMP